MDRHTTPNLDGDLDEKESWPRLLALTSIFLVELPGIEPGPKIDLSCGNVEFNYAKRRQMTRNDLRIRRRCDGINIARPFARTATAQQDTAGQPIRLRI